MAGRSGSSPPPRLPADSSEAVGLLLRLETDASQASEAPLGARDEAGIARAKLAICGSHFLSTWGQRECQARGQPACQEGQGANQFE